jgi:hypothetical protein
MGRKERTEGQEVGLEEMFHGLILFGLWSARVGKTENWQCIQYIV